jgi:hypothetical protein
MELQSSSTPTNYQRVTVDVPEDRIAEFHAFFARFLAGRSGPGRRGRHGRPHRGAHRGRCAERRGATEQREQAESPQATEQAAGTIEV